jgi:hypothetical protein
VPMFVPRLSMKPVAVKQEQEVELI